MALNLDISELTQAAAMKATPHDNCIVLGLGTGAFPRDIEVRLPDDDGARQNALWDGSLNLSINDEVLCFEYSGLSAWRVMGMGGNEGGAGKARVSEIWESDFGAVALETDASGNVTINGTRTLTIPTDLVHAGDADTKLTFADNDVEITVGSLSMLKLTEAGQDLITLGPGSGDVDIDFNGDMFLKGSNGRLGLGTTNPTGVTGGSGSDVICHVLSTGDTFPTYTMERTGGVAKTDRKWTFGVANGGQWFLQDTGGSGNAILVDTSGNVALGGGVSNGMRLDIAAGAFEGAEMTDPGAGAANTYRLFAEDNGAGKTRLMVRFSSGAAQQIAIQP